LFVGKCHGTIVEPQVEDASSFGWDSIFVPDGFDKTFAEFTREEKNKVSDRGRALELVKEYLKSNSELLLDSLQPE